MKQHKTAGCERLETARQLFQIVAVFDINISEGSVRSDGIFDGHFITNLLQSVPLKILKIGNIWLNYVHVYVSLYDYRPNSSDNRCCAAKDAKTY